MRLFNYIKNFYKGDLRLLDSYFLIGGLGSIVVIFITVVLMLLLDIIFGQFDILRPIFSKVYAIIGLWMIFVSIGLFRSANKYIKNTQAKNKSIKSITTLLIYLFLQLSSTANLFVGLYWIWLVITWL